MNKLYLEELKDFVILHIKSQNSKHINYKKVLSQIDTYETEEEGSWEYEWKKEGDKVAEYSVMEAIQCYNFSRFPFPKNNTQKRCQKNINNSMEDINSGIYQKEIINTDEGKFSVLISNKSSKYPLLIVMGGIVSIKEQWIEFLKFGKKFGYTVILAEFPRVGENTLFFHRNSYKMIDSILNHFKGCINTNEVYYVGMSFGGQLGVQQACSDNRIKGIVTVGAPLSCFYSINDYEWEKLPNITKETLSYITGLEKRTLLKSLNTLAINVEKFKNFSIPITYIQSVYDEIIPYEEGEFLKKNVRKLNLVKFLDIHGSPNYMKELKLIIMLNVLKQSKKNIYSFIVNIAYSFFKLIRIIREG